jgi:hypothetical protein
MDCHLTPRIKKQVLKVMRCVQKADREELVSDTKEAKVPGGPQRQEVKR